MPFESKAQRRLFWAKERRGEMTKSKIKEWERETPKNIPERVKSSEVLLPDHAIDGLLGEPESAMGYQVVDLHLTDGRVIQEVPVMNSEMAITDEDIGTDDIAMVEKTSDITKKKLKKNADMVKWTAFNDELKLLNEGGLGDSESSSKTQFPYAPSAGRSQ